MNIIYQQTRNASLLLSKQSVNPNIKYRPFFYMINHPVKDGMLVYHTLTKSLVFLSDDEAKNFRTPDLLDTKTKEFLVNEYFLVPHDHDDKAFMLQFVNSMAAVRAIYTQPKLTSFVIFTTSDCNARCFYCFERGTRKVTMTEQIAHDVADFIEKKAEKAVNIRWFGGEPLYNDKAIDIISSDLREKGITYHSTMVTNGYLFDEEMIARATSLWNLKRVQITLDGTEKVYNRIKNYIYKDDPSPFQRVLDNTQRLLEADIAVQIRLNMDTHNAEDLRELSELLVRRFHSYAKCLIYVKLLYEDTSDAIQNRADEERHALIQKSIDLQKYIDQNMPKPFIEKLPDARKEHFCMTDNDRSAMIFADGNLGRCEHYTDDDFYGSIYSDSIDFQNILYHKKMVTVVPECDDCAFRNLCRHPACCTSNRANRCDDFDKLMVKNRFASKMDNTYRKFMEEQNEAKG